MHRVTAVAVGVLAGLLLADGGTTQQPEGPNLASTVTPEDSVDLLAAARSDQASFERFRRRRLPSTWGGGSSRCDERIGRFCLNHNSGASDWVPPPEDEEVVEARLSLIDGLSQVAELIPGDRWIAGQLVRYLVDARRFDEAVDASGRCRAEPWWCAALTGFAHHYSGDAERAESAFDIALELMEPDERDRWTDLTLILDDRTVRVYRRMDEREKADFADRFWRLADPLLTRPGNELKSEHLTRHVWNALQDRAEPTDAISWGWDLREILIRYGWPSGWEQTRSFGMNLEAGRPPLVSHYSSAPRGLLPPAEALLGETATEGSWDQDERRSRTAYNLPLGDSVARWFSPLDHQVAVFRRGETSVVAAAYELPRDSLPEGATVLAGLSLLPTGDPTLSADVTFASDSTGSGAILLEAISRPVLMTLEVVVPSERRIGRARYGLNLSPITPGLLALSDLLLVDGAAELPDSLHAAARIARGSQTFRSGEGVGVYWETYGIDPESTPSVIMSLRLLQARTGWLRRLGERAGLLREVAPIRLRWEEAVTGFPYHPRSIHIEIPDVNPGEYVLELAVEAAGREALSVRKEIEIVGG